MDRQSGHLLKEAHTEGRHADIVSLDISKALNRTWTPLVLQQLVKWGFTGNILGFIRNFLDQRYFRVWVGNSPSEEKPEQTGVPQGSVLAVTLFLIAMSGLHTRLPKNVYLFIYADDILLVAIADTPGRARIKIQAAVNAVARWTNEMGFSLSASKSARGHVCRFRHQLGSPAITINGERIPNRNTVKVLGVSIDRNLAFRSTSTRSKKAAEPE